MKPEYDFSVMKGGTRGRYFEAYRRGHKVIINREDGTAAIQYFTLEDGAVMLEPEVRKYFPDAASVNKARKTLIEILPAKKRAPGSGK